MYVLKVIKFSSYGGCRYNKSNAKTGEFISESNGFNNDGHNSLPYLDNSKIIDIWFNLIITKDQTIPFIPTYDEALLLIKNIKKLKKDLKNLCVTETF